MAALLFFIGTWLLVGGLSHFILILTLTGKYSIITYKWKTMLFSLAGFLLPFCVVFLVAKDWINDKKS